MPVKFKSSNLEITSAMLHILAMASMVCDHLRRTAFPQQTWLAIIGRLAFPIFAFLLTEGYFYTRNLKHYLLRLLLCAIVSEIPFDLFISGSVFDPSYQNVIWTFLIGIVLIDFNEKAKHTQSTLIVTLTGISSIVLGFLIGLVFKADYHYAGIYMILVFYFLRGRKWWNYAGQFFLLGYINTIILQSLTIKVELLGMVFHFALQEFALLALIPIWLYRGKQGTHYKTMQYVYYGFYPVHLLILGIMRRYLV